MKTQTSYLYFVPWVVTFCFFLHKFTFKSLQSSAFYFKKHTNHKYRYSSNLTSYKIVFGRTGWASTRSRICSETEAHKRIVSSNLLFFPFSSKYLPLLLTAVDFLTQWWFGNEMRFSNGNNQSKMARFFVHNYEVFVSNFQDGHFSAALESCVRCKKTLLLQVVGTSLADMPCAAFSRIFSVD